jgi:hypothetical protein
MSETPTPRPVGRPSEYYPAYCAQAVAFGKQGKSKAYIAAQFGVSRQTLDTWTKAHPEFLDAITRAMALSQAWWEDAGQKGMTADKFNASVWSRSMAARFPEDWRENSRHEHTGANGGPIQTVDLSQVSDADLDRLEKILGGADPGRDQGGEGEATG